MNIFIVIAMALICGFQLSAQESGTNKSKEYWLSAPLPQNFNPFSLTFDYKVNLKNNTWLSFSALNLAFRYSENSPVASYDFKTSAP